MFGTLHRPTATSCTRGTLIGLVLLTQSGVVFGYCRTTTCEDDVAREVYCAAGESGCVIDGLPLGWPAGSTVHFALDAGSAAAADVDDATTSVEAAVGAWDEVRCDGERANIRVAMASESEDDDADAVITIEFLSASWPYEENAVGRTVIEFDEDTGAVSGAAIYLNAEQYVLKVSPRDLEVDLTAVLTHEIGHVLALGHTTVEGATMFSEAEVGFTSDFTTLEADDEAGLCALYPPDEDTVVFDLGEGGSPVVPAGEDPMTSSGCSQSAARPSHGGWWLSLSLFLTAVVGARGLRRERLGSP
jgi:hypothetical protein